MGNYHPALPTGGRTQATVSSLEENRLSGFLLHLVIGVHNSTAIVKGE
jgi:hypothetical protein